ATNRRWLIVLDDLASPADLADLWPPHTPVGSTIVTTRRRDAALHGHGRRVLEIDLFTAEQASDYLDAKLAAHTGLADDIIALSIDPGRIPVALAQAAAYMLDRHMPCSRYRTALADQRRLLVDIVPEPDALPDGHRATLAATWSLSFELANQTRPVG